MVKLTKTSKLFLITGILIFLFSIINRYLLIDEPFGKNGDALGASFLSSDLFMVFGFIFLGLSLLYLRTNKKYKIRFSETTSLLHYITLTLFAIALMFVPVLDTINGGGQISGHSSKILNATIIISFISLLFFIISSIVFLVNIFSIIGKIGSQLLSKK
jgi:cytochrome bd-type quinol oxidase subunit 2